MKLAFKTFGCRANSVDTDYLWMEARRRGFSLVSDSDIADAYIINSCTVTEGADRDARNQVRRFKRQNPEALVAVVGCYGQVGREELLKNSQIDFVLGTAEKFRVLDLFQTANAKRLATDQVSPNTGFLPSRFTGSRRSRASIKVQDVCNFKCTFCIIPQARGRSRSLPINTVIKQVSDAYEMGYEEVVLTGIHLAHYGWDHNTDLSKLVAKLLEMPGPRIRLSTLDPFEIPDDLLSLLSKNERFCPYFHIALQSGSDLILKKMRRIYKAVEFEEITAKILKANPNTFIGVDVIVGFPGETEVEFKKTVECLKRSYWTKLHVFPYSKRADTPAATYPEQVASSEINKRSLFLRELSSERYLQFLQSQVGAEKNTILERKWGNSEDVWLGHTDNFIPTLTKVTDAQSKQSLRTTLEAVEKERVWANPL